MTPETTTTGSGNSSCGNCVFPFTFMEVEHTGCTTIDGDTNPWCSTLVDENGVHVSGGGHWEYCGSECPTVTPPTTTTPPPPQRHLHLKSVPRRIQSLSFAQLRN